PGRSATARTGPPRCRPRGRPPRPVHTLMVLRHAKAAGEPGVNDHERPLAGRGRRNATAVGQWLLTQGLAPDRVLCSSSRRTRETWERVSAALGAAAALDQDSVSFDRRV